MMNKLWQLRAALIGAIFSLIPALAVLLLSATPLRAEGVFISAPNRTDIAYDDKRGVLYISNGGQLLRYQVATRTLLAPITLGGTLGGMDISPDGESLVVTDNSYSSTQSWVYIVSLATLSDKKVTFPLAFGEAGTFTAAYGSNGGILIDSRFSGSGWVPLRWFDPSTQTATTIATVDQDTMLRASADHSLIALAESDSSDGPFDRYRVSDGNLLRKSGYTDGTSWFNYEIAVRPDGQQYAIPTYGGTFFTDAALVKSGTMVGQYAAGQPIGVAYDPVKPLVYFPWATTTLVYAYDSTTLTAVRSYDFESTFGANGNFAFRNGRAKTSSDGSLLFVTVAGGVRFVTLDAVAPSGLTAIASSASVTLHWSASSNAGSYVVYAGTSPGQEAATPVLAGIAGTSATISGLLNNTTYYFTVAAITTAGLSTPSTEASATPIAVPAAVTGFSAYTGSGPVTVYWSAAAGATSYTLYLGTASGTETVRASGLTGTSYVTTLPGYGTPYFLQLAGVNASGSGPRSAEVSFQPAQPPVASASPGVYAGRQIVQLSTPTPGATIFYTTDGSTPTPNSAVYAAPLQVVANTTIKAFAGASGFSNSAIATMAYTIVAAVQPVSLASAYSLDAIATPGQPAPNHGMDNHGYAYSGALLGRTLVWSGTAFNIGGPGVLDALSGGTVSLPPGRYADIKLLAAGVNGSQQNQAFIITYLDGSSTTITQSLSDWHTPQHFPGESIALAMAYRETPTGTQQSGPFNLYGYSFALSPAKPVKSITLPANRNLVVLAISMGRAPAAAAVMIDLSAAANTDAVFSGSRYLLNGIDGHNYAYAAQLLPSYMVWSAIPFQLPIPDQLDALEYTTAPLPQGNFSQMYLLGTGVNGDQPNRTIVVTYTDGSSDSFVQSFSDWHAPQHHPGENIVVSMAYRIGLNGVTQPGPWYLYGYSFNVNPLKDLRSISLPNRNVAALSITLNP